MGRGGVGKSSLVDRLVHKHFDPNKKDRGHPDHRLAGMQKNFLDFEDYRKECQKLGEHEADAQERLAGFLHSLGVVLNFRDDPRLNDTHVLNPIG